MVDVLYGSGYHSNESSQPTIYSISICTGDQSPHGDIFTGYLK